MSRSAATELAREIVRNLDLLARERRLAMLDEPRGQLSLAHAVSSGLVQAVASALENPANAVPYRPIDEAYRFAEILRNLKEGGWRRNEIAETDVLFVPRTEPHMRDMLNVAPLLRDHFGLRASWAVFRAADERRARSLGAQVTNATAMSLSHAGVQWILRMHVHDLVAEVKERLPHLSDALGAAEAYLQRNASLATQRYAAMSQVFAQAKPKVVVVGNAALLEGRIAVALAHRSGARVVMAQHGDMIADPSLYSSLGVDLYCVWGPRSRDLLAESGVSARAVAVVGAPWLDSENTMAARRTEQNTVLVAFSGAGHMVGEAEHVAAVDAVFRAVDAHPELRWMIRVHPKDDPEAYRRIAHQKGHGRVQVLASKDSPVTIRDQLATSAALVTIMSTAALDAMLFGVPVVTFPRSPSEHLPDYVRDGATVHLSAHKDLGPRLVEIMRGGTPESVTQRAREFAERFYGPLDGQSSKRLAHEISALAKR